MSSDNDPIRQGTEDGPRWDRGQRITGTERQTIIKELVRRYSDGASIRQLASSIGRSYGFVHGALTEAGVLLRTRGGSRQRRTRHTGQR